MPLSVTINRTNSLLLATRKVTFRSGLSTACQACLKAALDKHSTLGIPVKGGRKKTLLIYAWNDFGEGGIVAPTKGETEMKLEAVRQVLIPENLGSAEESLDNLVWPLGVIHGFATPDPPPGECRLYA